MGAGVQGWLKPSPCWISVLPKVLPDDHVVWGGARGEIAPLPHGSFRPSEGLFLRWPGGESVRASARERAREHLQKGCGLQMSRCVTSQAIRVSWTADGSQVREFLF